MMGFDAPYSRIRLHGLPIELYVDKKLGAKKAQMPATAFAALVANMLPKR